MSNDLADSISRLTAWIRDFGAEKNQTFIADLQVVIEAARKHAEAVAEYHLNLQYPPSGRRTPEYDAMPPLITQAELHCTCHERDGSYVCPHCYAQGRRGHMQRSTEDCIMNSREFAETEFPVPDTTTQIPPDIA